MTAIFICGSHLLQLFERRKHVVSKLSLVEFHSLIVSQICKSNLMDSVYKTLGVRNHHTYFNCFITTYCLLCISSVTEKWQLSSLCIFPNEIASIISNGLWMTKLPSFYTSLALLFSSWDDCQGCNMVTHAEQMLSSASGWPLKDALVCLLKWSLAMTV